MGGDGGGGGECGPDFGVGPATGSRGGTSDNPSPQTTIGIRGDAGNVDGIGVGGIDVAGVGGGGANPCAPIKGVNEGGR